MNPMEVRQIKHLPPQIHVLEEVAFTEGFRFLTRLISEWQSGDNRFDAPGECLMAAYLNHELVGVGGLSVDPYAQANTGRLGRVYVAPTSRGQHVGQRLVSALIAHAALHFKSVRLYTDTLGGDAFYLRCGFMLTEDAHATHVMQIETSDSDCYQSEAAGGRSGRK
ncbi:GNAT family N-acetyltransferase [Pseudomonas sp. LS-2]|uniref:GNAT family N-acetyltransferase n=1 Tax=Pseudomonas sp. LS-2 TaxID=2315859 RepID=UPI000E74D76B|nr:GNAT family N-acetyltransferase [Pseudomonas sp. LS-2]RJX78974.1 GNAT family N-acetyltransferase [Pseudomonas sp. LS-2]